MLIEGTMTGADGSVTEFQVDAEGFAQWYGKDDDVVGRGRILDAITQVLAEYEEGDL